MAFLPFSYKRFVATSTSAGWATVTIVLSAILSVFTQFWRFLTYSARSGSQLQFVFYSLIEKSASLASFSPVLDSKWEPDLTGVVNIDAASISSSRQGVTAVRAEWNIQMRKNRSNQLTFKSLIP
jgi:hypothetical protein